MLIPSVVIVTSAVYPPKKKHQTCCVASSPYIEGCRTLGSGLQPGLGMKMPDSWTAPRFPRILTSLCRSHTPLRLAGPCMAQAARPALYARSAWPRSYHKVCERPRNDAHDGTPCTPFHSEPCRCQVGQMSIEPGPGRQLQDKMHNAMNAQMATR